MYCNTDDFTCKGKFEPFKTARKKPAEGSRKRVPEDRSTDKDNTEDRDTMVHRTAGQRLLSASAGVTPEKPYRSS